MLSQWPMPAVSRKERKVSVKHCFQPAIISTRLRVGRTPPRKNASMNGSVTRCGRRVFLVIRSARRRARPVQLACRISTDALLTGTAPGQHAVRHQGIQGLVPVDWISQAWATSRKLRLRGIVACRLRAAIQLEETACVCKVRACLGSKNPGWRDRSRDGGAALIFHHASFALFGVFLHADRFVMSSGGSRVKSYCWTRARVLRFRPWRRFGPLHGALPLHPCMALALLRTSPATRSRLNTQW